MGHARQIAEAHYRNFEADDHKAMDELFADDCTIVTPSGTLDKAAHAAFGRALRAAFPDSRMELTRAIESGDEVFVQGRFKGTHTGDLVSPGVTIPASGRAIDFPYVEYFRVADGNVVASEAFFDQMTLLGQIGAL